MRFLRLVLLLFLFTRSNIIFIIIVEAVVIIHNYTLLGLIVSIIVLRHDALMMMLQLRVRSLFIDDSSNSHTISGHILAITTAIEKWIERSRHREEALIWVKLTRAAAKCKTSR